MYKRKLIVLISLIGIGIGTYFIFNFYNIFFWNNTVFKNKHSYVFIDHDDTMDSLHIQLEPLLKSSQNFLIAAEKKGYSQNIKPGKYRLIRVFIFKNCVIPKKNVVKIKDKISANSNTD
jgi:UPF0755 protein